MELKDIESAIEAIQVIKTSKAQIDILWKIGNSKSEMYDILYKIESTKMQEAIKKTLAALEAAKVKKIGEVRNSHPDAVDNIEDYENKVQTAKALLEQVDKQIM